MSMRIPAMVEFYPANTQLIEPKKSVPGEHPIVSMSFKSIPAVGHLIESPNQNYPASVYRVAQIFHSIHGDITIKVIPA